MKLPRIDVPGCDGIPKIQLVDTLRQLNKDTFMLDTELLDAFFESLVVRDIRF